MTLPFRVAALLVAFIFLVVIILGLLQRPGLGPLAFLDSADKALNFCDGSNCAPPQDHDCDYTGACRSRESLEDRLEHLIRKLFQSSCHQDCGDDFSLKFYIKLAISIAITVTISVMISIRVVARFIGELNIKVQQVVVETIREERVVRTREEPPFRLPLEVAPAAKPELQLAPMWYLFVLLMLFLIFFLYLWYRGQ
jgi:hypothetical protein